jgi:ribosome-associated heat shock protein Hsp15
MRIDKYLWCIRKYKTRTLASEEVKKERVLLNDELVKASREVKEGDVLTLKKEGINFTYKVLDFPKSRVGAKLVDQYVKDITAASELEKQRFIGMMKKLNRRKGTGRPTKKERRDIDNLLDGEE